MKILIANRGEIAKRIAITCRELGVRSVGLYLESEHSAPHLIYCDEWVQLQGETLSETFLNINQILKIAEEYSVDGIHPGYGFLAENALFAKQVEEKDIVFIGPRHETISLLGDKGRSKSIAQEINFPTIPGSCKEVTSIEDVLKVTSEIGFPILLKAVNGGGGKGMRLCENEKDLRENFEIVKREAKASFGDAGLIVEKFITKPHHIEVQIFGDGEGNVVHFYERECSIQRRHQKIIEEAPSPFIGDDEELRKTICNYAIKIAAHVKYRSAGTVECIVDDEKNIYFLEMNTRIQVEHPVSENITGYDLIALMIKNSMGLETFHFEQDLISKRGHSIECRICAEDSKNMLPSIGKVHNYFVPSSINARFDHILEIGLEVTSYYDSMLGKLIVFAHNRNEAIRKISYILNNMLIYGIKTNITLLEKIIKSDIFISGYYNTSSLGEILKYEIEIEEDLTHNLLPMISLVEMKNNEAS